MAIQNKASVKVISGREKIGVNFTGLTEMIQSENGLVIFNKKNPVTYEFLGFETDGPVYNLVTDSMHTGKSTTKGKGKDIKKGKSGKVAGGALLGTLLFPGVGTVVGAYAGGKGKDKSKNKNKSTTIDDFKTTETQKQVEVKSECILKLKNTETSEKFTIIIESDSKMIHKLSNFSKIEEKQVLVDDSKSITEQLKEFKELLDMDIISQEEFDKKKIELLTL